MLSRLLVSWTLLQAAGGPDAPEAAAQPAPALGGGDMFRTIMVPFIAFMVFMWIFVYRQDSKRRKERERRIKSVKKGDTILTTGGLLGEVFRVDETELVVIIDDDKKVKARVARGAVHEILSELGAKDAKESAAPAEEAKARA